MIWQKLDWGLHIKIKKNGHCYSRGLCLFLKNSGPILSALFLLGGGSLTLSRFGERGGGGEEGGGGG